MRRQIGVVIGIRVVAVKPRQRREALLVVQRRERSTHPTCAQLRGKLVIYIQQQCLIQSRYSVSDFTVLQPDRGVVAIKFTAVKMFHEFERLLRSTAF